MTGKKSGSSSARRKSEKAVSCLELTSCEVGVRNGRLLGNRARGVEVLSYLAVLIHSRIKCATDSVLGLKDLDLKGFGAKGAVRLQQVLGSHQAARAGANDSNLSYGLHDGWVLGWIMMLER